jgi:hypothetical protein
MNESEFNAEFRRSERKRQNLRARHAAGELARAFRDLKNTIGNVPEVRRAFSGVEDHVREWEGSQVHRLMKTISEDEIREKFEPIALSMGLKLSTSKWRGEYQNKITQSSWRSFLMGYRERERNESGDKTLFGSDAEA